MDNFIMRTVSEGIQLPVSEGGTAKRAQASRTCTSEGYDSIVLAVGGITISLDGNTVIQQVEAIISLLQRIKSADCSLPGEEPSHA